MNIVLISKVEDTQLVLLNALLSSIHSLFDPKILHVDVIFISKNEIDNTMFFLKRKYETIYYLKQTKAVIRTQFKTYDYLISIEHSFLGLLTSRKIKAKVKTSFKGFLSFLIFDKQIKRINKKITLTDLSNLLETTFSQKKEVNPQYYVDDEKVRKNEEMLQWVFKTNYNLELNIVKYILVDFKIRNQFRQKQLKMLSDLCTFLTLKFNYKIIIIHHSKNREDFQSINQSLEKQTIENLIVYPQNFNHSFEIFPIYKNAKIVITNKKNLLNFLTLIEYKCYFINDTVRSLKTLITHFYKSEKWHEKLTRKSKNEIQYIIKRVDAY